MKLSYYFELYNFVFSETAIIATWLILDKLVLFSALDNLNYIIHNLIKLFVNSLKLINGRDTR